ncbi:MAG TPA: MFS transporter [Geobacterales bacterium]|nr:MFS transporter [Geobacterales bacterium]
MQNLETEEKYDLKYAYRAAVLLASIPLLVMYTEAMLIPSLPTMQRSFNVTEAQISWVLSLYLAFGTVSAALLGKLGDVYGKKKIMMIAMLTYTAGATLTGFSTSFTMLLFSRAIQGMGVAMMPLAFSIVREEFPPRMIPQVQGIISAMFGVGVLISLPIGAYISQNYGWQATYHTVIPFIIIMDILAFFLIRESRYRNPQKIDWLGAIILSLCLITGIIGIAEAPSLGWLNAEVLALLTISLISLVAFAIYERRIDNPLIPIFLFSNKNIAIANFGIFLASFIFQLMSQAITYIFQMPQPNGYALTILESGLWMTPTAIIQLIAAPIAGRQLFKIGTKPFAIIGSIISAMGLLILSYTAFVTIPSMVSTLVFTSFGSTLINVSLINMVIFSVDKRNIGIATGLNTVFRNIGAAWGPAIAGTIMNQYQDTIYIGKFPLSVPSHFAYQLIFYITAAMFIVLLVSLFFASEVLKNNNK